MNAAEPFQEIVNRRNNRRNHLGNRPNRRVEPTELPEYVPNFKEIIHTIINKKTPSDEFDKLLIETGSLVAGGSVLAASQGPEPEINDFDIYVPIENAFTFFEGFVAFLFKMHRKDHYKIKYNEFAASFYCNSFLRRNGIKQVHRFRIKTIYTDDSIFFDIMTVRKIRKPIDIVNNFDLTFCQTWYDGKTIWASHPEDVRSKKGKLQGDYRKLFIDNNSFIHKRVKKYIEKGYEVALDEFTADEIKDSFIFNKVVCPNPVEASDKYAGWEENSFVNKWATRALKKSFLNEPYLEHVAQNTYIIRYRRLYPSQTKYWDDNYKTKEIENNFKIKEDDGYDTDEYIDEPKLLALAHNTYRDTTPEFPELALALTPELKFHRMANRVIRNAIWPLDPDGPGNGSGREWMNFGRLYYGTLDHETGNIIRHSFPNVGHACEIYFKGLQDKGLRVTDEDYLFASEGDIVYDLHKHPMEGGISKENLQIYLRSQIAHPNKNQIPCYWKPESAGSADSSRNCTQHLTLKDIFYCVDFNFFFKFKQGDVRDDPSLLLNIPKYDQILYNTKEGEPKDPSWPDLFHQGVCPFCLESVTREAGCIYMTHPNPRGRPDSESPYCNPALAHKGMLDHYRKQGRRADPTYIPNVKDHLEFCIECGRPSYNHKHFTYDDPEELIEGRADKCKGDGRVELYARVLAIRESFKKNGDRKKAAEAAQEAPTDVDEMNIAKEAYAVAISHAEGEDRVWGNEASDRKESEEENLNAAALRLFEGGKRKRYNKTRKTQRR